MQGGPFLQNVICYRLRLGSHHHISCVAPNVIVDTHFLQAVRYCGSLSSSTWLSEPTCVQTVCFEKPHFVVMVETILIICFYFLVFFFSSYYFLFLVKSTSISVLFLPVYACLFERCVHSFIHHHIFISTHTIYYQVTWYPCVVFVPGSRPQHFVTALVIFGYCS